MNKVLSVYDVHPWRRWFARMIDIIAFNIVISGPLGLLYADIIPRLGEKTLLLSNNVVFGSILLFILWMPFEVLFLAYWGSTPGKWMMGVSLEKNNGGRLGFSKSFHRTFGIWFRGLGFNIPIVSLITQYFSYLSLVKLGITKWDDKNKIVVCHRNEMSNIRMGVLAITIMLILFAIFN